MLFIYYQHLAFLYLLLSLQTTFVNTIDAPSLALLVPIVHRGLRERSEDSKKKAAQIVGNMCSLVTEPKDMLPYISLMLPEVNKVLAESFSLYVSPPPAYILTFENNPEDFE